MDLALVVAAALVVVAILSARFSQRFGMPALLLFVAVGMFAGSSGPLGIDFEDYGLSLNIGLLALAVIIFSGGLGTRYRLFRAAVLPAGLLATVGVLLTAGILALLAWWLTPLDLTTALLLGAVLGSTDAAATFSALKGRGLPGRLRAVLETESGTNDPVAIYLTIALVSMASAGALGAFGLVAGVVLQLGLGALYGYAAGKVLIFLINRVALDGAGLYPILALAGALLAYGLANLGFGNGFVTIYVVGLVLGNAHLVHRRSIATFMDGAAWGAQVLMFVLLGLLAFPERLGASLPAAIVIMLALALVARPVAVAATLGVLRLATRGRYAFTLPEITLLSWAGLKGAVPIILAILPLLSAVPGAEAVFDVVFVVVILGTTLQGATIAPLARWLRLERMEPPRPPVTLELGGAAPVGAAVFDLYLEADRRAVGARLSDLDIPDDVVIAGILRDGKMVTPRGSTVFMAGDHVYLISGDADTVGIPPAFSGRRRSAPQGADAPERVAAEGVAHESVGLASVAPTSVEVEQAATEPVATKPVATKPVATETVATKPVATKESDGPVREAPRAPSTQPETDPKPAPRSSADTKCT